ncbi:CHAT domain-containing protein [Amycolatopsis sp., V23-08]|uniref:CHAT domain-containing protein n=1 Tax=Amycolatopsis heterodermiae TaxID=3110235 RepID=A0ABU5RAW5_9PSEU|nr:CHAT domain-containing protein [Amycolatopsis sp., V23-08]MEA5362909.1 CHAT domain-containing protein [Amycolatopsis sp., V23-08]
MSAPRSIGPEHPAAALVARAGEAFTTGDVRELDRAYQAIVPLVAGTAVAAAVAVDHVSRLLTLEHPTRARNRCEEHLARHPREAVLRVLLAEIASSTGDHERVRSEAKAIRRSKLDDESRARLLRVEGLAAADDGPAAAELFAAAARLFAAAGNAAGVASVGRARELVAVRRGDADAVARVLATEGARPKPDPVRLALALKRELRYEEALRVLRKAARSRRHDHALLFPVLHECAVLLRLTRQDEKARQVVEQLEELAATARDPAAARAAIALVSGDVQASWDERFDHRLRHVRQLVESRRIADAEHLLPELRPAPEADRETALWHLAAGELAQARYQETGRREFLAEAARRFRVTVRHTDSVSLHDVRQLALRLLGRVHARLGDAGQAGACWAEAHRIEEDIAGRQVTDDVRIRMLLAAPDEHDERVRAAGELVAERGPEAAAGVAAAIEAARGTSILGAVLPGRAGAVRDLPALADFGSAWRWLSRTTRDLPRSQVVWLLHATPERVYHAIAGRDLLLQFSVGARALELSDAVGGLLACCSGDVLPSAIESGDFEKALARIGDLIGVAEVVEVVPPHVERIAVVAGGVLSEIPLAGLLVPDTAERLGHRFALSDLPCLSARDPLRRRASRQRGDRTLRIRPPVPGLSRTKVPPRCTPLDDADATTDRLQEEVKTGRYHRIRVDAHGAHDPATPARSWLQLSPEGGQGRWYAEDLRAMDLGSCATLVLGACESGMARRRGRDERAGFVRAGLQAGASTVVAARWDAQGRAATKVLDRFERYVRYLPRDVALQRAQLDLCRETPALGHPAHWACWTLYGDPGLETAAGPLRRFARRIFDPVRNRDADAR